MKKTFKDTIEDIRKGFNKWRYHNEESVKQGIILPILDSLKWDIFDTRIVCPQHYIPEINRAIKVDYVLYKDLNPYIIIEAKTLSGYIRTARYVKENKKQIDEYAEYFNPKITRKVVTDGLYWRLYNAEGTELKINIMEDIEETHFLEDYIKKVDTQEWNFKGNYEKKDHKLSLYDDFSSKNIELKVIGLPCIEFINNAKNGLGWGKSYFTFCQELYDIHKNKVIDFAKQYKYYGGKKVSFVLNESELKECENDLWGKIKFEKGVLYVNTAKSNNEHCTMIREMLKYLGIDNTDEEKVTITKK